MPEFQLKLTAPVLIIPTVCSGVLFMGSVLFLYILLRDRKWLYGIMASLSIVGALFVFSESMILFLGGLFRDPATGMQFHRLEQIFVAMFIFLIPFFLANFLELSPFWKRSNRVLVFAMLAVSVFFIVVSFVAPDLYVSVTQHRSDWLRSEADHGRGVEGPLYQVRDMFLAVMIFYALACFIAEMIIHRKFRYLIPPFTGLLLAVHGAVVDVISVYTHVFYDAFPTVRFSRFTLGITLFILFSMGGVLRRFFDLAGEVARAREEAHREAEINSRQNAFIRDVLSSGSEELVRSTENLSDTIEGFTHNTQEQAAATEEVTASIEEIMAGNDGVMKSAEEQSGSIGDLTSTMESLSRAIQTMGERVKDALSSMAQISQNASMGEQSLRIMNDSMININRSTAEITGIAQIINDISDRINLLSLNAAIEAARAGDAGRGFAVVADEISKLADQTATSIKNIDSLIATNEKEISTGIQNITMAVERIDSIMTGIETIVVKTTEISEGMKEQLDSNRTVNEKAAAVKIISGQIMDAMVQQRTAIGEISSAVGSINELSQHNSIRIIEITDSSRSLVTRVEGLNHEIEEFKAGD